MSDLQARLDALPEWPEPITNFDISVRDWARWQHEGRLAALARLALAHDLAKDGDPILTYHSAECYYTIGGRLSCKCTCGRDALLAKLEGPK